MPRKLSKGAQMRALLDKKEADIRQYVKVIDDLTVDRYKLVEGEKATRALLDKALAEVSDSRLRIQDAVNAHTRARSEWSKAVSDNRGLIEEFEALTKKAQTLELVVQEYERALCEIRVARECAKVATEALDEKLDEKLLAPDRRVQDLTQDAAPKPGAFLVPQAIYSRLDRNGQRAVDAAIRAAAEGQPIVRDFRRECGYVEKRS